MAAPKMAGTDARQQTRTRRLAGIVTTAELKAAGTSPIQITTLVRRGVLRPVFRGVYADAAAATEMLGRKGGDQLLSVAAALAVVGPTAVASHQSAAYLHAIDLVSRESAVSLTCPPDRGWRGRAGIQVHAMALPPEHVTTVVGLRVTSPARTVGDLARTLEVRDGLVAADSALHRRLVTKADLTSALAACAHFRGARRAAEVIDFADGLAESPLESIARLAFRDCGLPQPELQVWLGGTAEPIGRVDFYWRDYWTIAEVDGAGKYANPERARAQLRRDSLLREDGFEVVHFTWQQIDRMPQQVAASIRAAFRRGVRNATRPGRSASGEDSARPGRGTRGTRGDSAHQARYSPG